jgi:hypothetical protein
MSTLASIILWLVAVCLLTPVVLGLVAFFIGLVAKIIKGGRTK